MSGATRMSVRVAGHSPERPALSAALCARRCLARAVQPEARAGPSPWDRGFGIRVHDAQLAVSISTGSSIASPGPQPEFKFPLRPAENRRSEPAAQWARHTTEPATQPAFGARHTVGPPHNGARYTAGVRSPPHSGPSESLPPLLQLLPASLAPAKASSDLLEYHCSIMIKPFQLKHTHSMVTVAAAAGPRRRAAVSERHVTVTVTVTAVVTAR